MRLGRRTGTWNEESWGREEDALGRTEETDALRVEWSSEDRRAAAAAAEVCERGVAVAEAPVDGAMEFGIVCKPESSNVAGRPMA